MIEWTFEKIASIVVVRCGEFDHKFKLSSCPVCNPVGEGSE